MIQHLRKYEEVILYNNILELTENDSKEVITFLELEFKSESLNYPINCPHFNEGAALWAAKTIYTATQLMLYREHKEADLAFLLPDFNNNPNPSEIVSADLCLRFLPDILNQLKLIDGEDKLIPLLEEKLTTWHFSGVNYPLDSEKIDFQNSISNFCLHQMYADRIILNKKIQLAKHPAFESPIAASMGIYVQELWKEFKTDIL